MPGWCSPFNDPWEIEKLNASVSVLDVAWDARERCELVSRSRALCRRHLVKQCRLRTCGVGVGGWMGGWVGGRVSGCGCGGVWVSAHDCAAC
jgi:hypothetical protein